VSLTLERRFGRRLKLVAFGSYTHSVSSSDAEQPLAPSDFLDWANGTNSCTRPGLENGSPICLVDIESALDEDFWNASVELSYQIRRNWSTFLLYGYRSYADDRPRRGDWNANRVTLGFRWSHDVPL
jgi:hypothetical protein